MVRIRPTTTEFINSLSTLHKAYFTLADLEKVLGLSRKSLYVTVNRLVKEGTLIHLRRNTYQVFTELLDVEKMANELYYPSYVSFETALSKHGILSQIPYTVTLATVRPSKKMLIRNVEVEYRHIKEDLFFGYSMVDTKYLADREKALLDMLYLVSRGRTAIHLEELDLKDVDRNRFDEYVKRFPPYLAPLVKEVRRHIGTTPIGLEIKERIHWNKR